MRYDIVYAKRVEKVLRSLPPKLARRILEKIEEVAEDPYGKHLNVTRLQGSHQFRLRVGDWRIIYELQDQELILFAVDLGARGGIYQ
jgi:mRNA interferase RelE/StbE